MTGDAMPYVNGIMDHDARLPAPLGPGRADMEEGTQPGVQAPSPCAADGQTASPSAGEALTDEEDNGEDDGDDDADDDVKERDEAHRFVRYDDVIGQGRFKVVYKGFDEQDGMDVAWGVISGDQHQLDGDTTRQLFQEIRRGTDLHHRNIIRCFKCWQCANSINLITELFTSGNLRDYVQQHQQLDSNALRKFCKQILQGLEYLHSREPSVIHGDLRCDKIYVNGHSGEIKIGDLGLVTLLARKYHTSEAGSSYRFFATANLDTVKRSPSHDIFAFGLCMLELYTQQLIDPEQVHDHAALIASVPDERAREILTRCLQPDPDARPTAAELSLNAFFSVKSKPAASRNPTPPPSEDATSVVDADHTLHCLRDQLLSSAALTRSNPSSAAPSIALDPHLAAGHRPLLRVKTCHIRGEDLSFSVSGGSQAPCPGCVSIKLTMTSVDVQDDGATPCYQRTVEFEFNVDEDSPEALGSELQAEYRLSETDTEIVRAILKECLDIPDDDGGEAGRHDGQGR